MMKISKQCAALGPRPSNSCRFYSRKPQDASATHSARIMGSTRTRADDPVDVDAEDGVADYRQEQQLECLPESA